MDTRHVSRTILDSASIGVHKNDWSICTVYLFYTNGRLDDRILELHFTYQCYLINMKFKEMQKNSGCWHKINNLLYVKNIKFLVFCFLLKNCVGSEKHVKSTKYIFPPIQSKCNFLEWMLFALAVLWNKKFFMLLVSINFSC